ncbi:hypothetical protein BKA67DRAFT_516936 [Truncatella angustata]|uniref:Uncharacterized protein n=1 Tax=Truncatella angustata TaxID=152316 RepID=A0A9P8UL05_9PEZI|nr:uncharacterized protein BKA67DRAFT_516936 [Truncatella angustata]KAH6654016.1 hypothetical protein BKA67DRAFT_516936 [Truncatella angustata]
MASSAAVGAGSGSATGPGAGAGTAAALSSTSTAKSEHSSNSTPKYGQDAPDANATRLPLRDKDSFDQVRINQYITRDHLHAAAIVEDQRRLNDHNKDTFKMIQDYKMVRNEGRHAFPPSRLYGEGYNGYGNGRTELGGPARLLYPQQKPRLGKQTTPPLKWKRRDMKQQAEQHEELIPVRLDVDMDKIRLRDTFTWNLHERLAAPELFAMQLIEDMGLKPPVAQPIYEQVIVQMKEQLNDFYPFVFSDEDALDPELPYSAWKNDEMRVLIKLNITIGQLTLVDQFEWDMNNPLNSPEEFATSMAKEMSLSGEFVTAIAHCIREQTHLFARSLYSIGHPFDGRPIEDPDLVAAFLPSPLPTVFRPQQQAKEYAPYLYELSEQELEKNEVIFQREQRRQKRATVTRRGGPSLPDLKERQRTIRTLVVSSVLPGAAINVEDSTLYKRVAGTGVGRKGRVRDDLSDSDDSEDSSPDSPAAAQLQGTARTRGMRGAASAAVSRMANIGRSETPEATIHHHETRTSRRSGRELTREATEEPQHMIVTLRVGKEKLRQLYRDLKLKQGTPSATRTPSMPHTRAPSASVSSSMPPPSTPNASSTAATVPAKPPANGVAPGQISRVDAPAPTPTTPVPTPPPPPAWLVQALEAWKETAEYANDQFEGLMRYTALDATTNVPCSMPQAGNPISPNIKFCFLPRIRCLDCPGKLYTPGPEMTAINFEVHLKNRAHREKVQARLRGEQQ